MICMQTLSRVFIKFAKVLRMAVQQLHCRHAHHFVLHKLWSSTRACDHSSSLKLQLSFRCCSISLTSSDLLLVWVLSEAIGFAPNKSTARSRSEDVMLLQQGLRGNLAEQQIEATCGGQHSSSPVTVCKTQHVIHARSADIEILLE